jgi:hypothetical protein
MDAPRAEAFSRLLRDPRLWTRRDFAAAPTVPTGHGALDAQLPGGGWPLGAITELMPARPGIGELSLAMPALARLAGEGRRIAVVQPPYRACAPAWSHARIPLPQMLLVEAPRAGDALWAAEQVLRSAAFGAALLWASAAHEWELRRLQLACEQGATLLFLFRPPAAAQQPSPAALRLRLDWREGAGLAIDILKSRGGSPRALSLHLPGRAPAPAPEPAPSNAVVLHLPAAPAMGCAA